MGLNYSYNKPFIFQLPPLRMSRHEYQTQLEKQKGNDKDNKESKDNDSESSTDLLDFF